MSCKHIYDLTYDVNRKHNIQRNGPRKVYVEFTQGQLFRILLNSIL